MKTILIHGLGQTAGAWNKTTELLPQEDVLCPELSAFIGGGSYGELYSGFSGYLDELGQPLFLCGLSLGAVLALNYAIDRPGSVRGLALAAPQFRMPKALLRFQGAGFPAHAGEVVFRLRAYQKADDIPHRRHGASGLHAVAGQDRMSRVNSLRRARQSQHQRRAGTGKYPPAGTANGHQRRRT